MEICFAMFYIFPFQKLRRLHDEKSYDIVGHVSIKEYKLLVVGVSYPVCSSQFLYRYWSSQTSDSGIAYS
jgi:hypothetical protein